jgi:hypothetical protein
VYKDVSQAKVQIAETAILDPDLDRQAAFELKGPKPGRKQQRLQIEWVGGFEIPHLGLEVECRQRLDRPGASVPEMLRSSTPG